MSEPQAGMNGASTARPLVEREQELEAIERCLTFAEGQTGQLLLIEGPPGIGKTRLLAEVGALAEGRGFRVLAARGGELERGFGFGVVRQVFEPLLAEADADERRTILAGAAQLAEPLFGSRPEPPSGSAADLGFRRLHGLYWLCANVAAEQPLLISADDAHWSDASSLRFLDYLSRRLEGLRVLVVVAHRPREADAEVELLHQLSSEPGTIVLRPAALSKRAVALLAEDVFDQAPDAAFAASCWGATGGNPFLVWELMRSFAKGGGRPTADAADRIAALGPETVAHSVRSRLGRLPPSTGRLCGALAVLGGEGELRHIAALAAATQDAALTDVDALVAAGLLESDGRGTVGFVHPTVRAAVYTDLPAAERERTHTAAARLLADEGRPSEEVASHLLQLHPGGEEWIADTLLSAGLDALARGAPEAAIPFLRRALDEPPSAAARPDVLAALGAAELNIGHPDAAEHLYAARGHLTEPSKLASTTVALMHALGLGGRIQEALNVVRESIDIVAPRDRETALGLEAILGSMIKISDERMPLSPRWQRYGPINGDTPSERLLLTEVAWERAFGGATADEVARLAERSVADGAEAMLAYGGSQVCEGAYLLALCDRFTPAEAALRDLLAAGVAAGSLWIISAAEHWLGHLMLRRGLVADAEAHGKAAMEMATLVGWNDVLVAHRCQFAQALAERGALAEAEDALDLAQLAPERTGSVVWTLALEGRAAVRLAQGRAQEALDDLFSVRDLETGRRAANPASCPWRSQAALALHALGEEGEARDLADEEVALARSFGAPRAIGIALRVSGLMIGGPEGEARLHEAAEVLEPSGAQLEHARALTDLGAAIRRTGRRVDAREPLRQSLALARACGATALAARAHQELLASGARPRRLSFSGVDSLTASERRVADMAARGMGNVEIAQALFVSRKTIETHLGHVYTKLGIASRRKLPAALAGSASEVSSSASRLV
jgi:DNA-binding CsgD family transcriptional regulator